MKIEVLSEKILFRLKDIFCNKGWEIDDCDNYTIFNRFCSRLAELKTDEEREFILELTEDYLWVKLEDYERYLKRSFDLYINNIGGELEDTIYAIPMWDVSCSLEMNHTKSGDALCYILQSCSIRTRQWADEKRIRIIASSSSLDILSNSNNYVLLIDDYIGSGDTAIGCLEVIKEYVTDLSRISVLSIVAQKEGINNIKKVYNDVTIYSAEIRSRAISDRYEKSEVEEKICSMKNISKQIGACKKYYLGYNNTEGLVSMIKTPNNTFPFFWYENGKHNKRTRAPFPRRGNIGYE